MPKSLRPYVFVGYDDVVLERPVAATRDVHSPGRWVEAVLEDLTEAGGVPVEYLHRDRRAAAV